MYVHWAYRYVKYTYLLLLDTLAQKRDQIMRRREKFNWPLKLYDLKTKNIFFSFLLNRNCFYTALEILYAHLYVDVILKIKNGIISWNWIFFFVLTSYRMDPILHKIWHFINFICPLYKLDIKRIGCATFKRFFA